jgi:hypothetical protein
MNRNPAGLLSPGMDTQALQAKREGKQEVDWVITNKYRIKYNWIYDQLPRLGRVICSSSDLS